MICSQIPNGTRLIKVAKKKLLKVDNLPLVLLGVTLPEALKVLLPLVRELVLPQVGRRGSSNGRVGVGQGVRGVACVGEGGVGHHSTIHRLLR